MPRHDYLGAMSPEALERRRLAALETSLDPSSRSHFLALGVRPGWACLEVGGGHGSIASWLAETVGATGRVVVFDIDTRFLDGIDLANVEIRKNDVLEAEVERSTYDVAHCRLLLAHVRDPEDALRRMIDATKPGGWVLVEEGDLASLRAVDPDHPRSEQFTRVMQRIFRDVAAGRFFDPYIGRRVRLLVERAGLSDVAFDGMTPLCRGGESPAEQARLGLPVLVKAGLCSEREAADVEAALLDPEFSFVGYTLFSAWGRRPQ